MPDYAVDYGGRRVILPDPRTVGTADVAHLAWWRAQPAEHVEWLITIAWGTALALCDAACLDGHGDCIAGDRATVVRRLLWRFYRDDYLDDANVVSPTPG